MIQTPVIITFANQKGGVGKTTLCVTFANYLVTKGVNVAIVDCDFQHSIIKCRKADIKKYDVQYVPYDVLSYEANDKKAIIALIEKMHNDSSLDVVLMDSPGSLQADGLVPMFVNSDIIVVPFHYDLMTVPSTASFLMFIDRLRKAVGGNMKAQLFIVPNLHDGRVGKRSELVIWENTRETFCNYGIVTGRIPKRADMERFSTMAALDKQVGIVTPVFERIYSYIFDTTAPIREPKLTGIQLTGNLEAELKGKAKENQPEENENQSAVALSQEESTEECFTPVSDNSDYWQDFLSYLESDTQEDKGERMICKLDRDLADSLDECNIHNRSRSDMVNAIVRTFFKTYLPQLAQYRRDNKSLFTNYKEAKA